jgi:pimeloyl-ACP methyl ester carboxylesterase
VEHSQIELRAGTSNLVDIAGPPGAHTVLLVHGWGGTADLNWSAVYETLPSVARVVATDLRGHGSGPRATFGITECADDLDELCERIGTGAVIAVGYSLGGAIVQRLAARHPGRVAGVVFAATSFRFGRGRAQRAGLIGLDVAGRRLLASSPWLAGRANGALATYLGRRSHLPGTTAGFGSEHNLGHDLGHDLVALAEAAGELGRFNGLLDLSTAGQRPPAVSIVTTRDRVVPPEDQFRLAALYRATTSLLGGGHDVCLRDRARFAACVTEAIGGVTARCWSQRSAEAECTVEIGGPLVA